MISMEAARVGGALLLGLVLGCGLSQYGSASLQQARLGELERQAVCAHDVKVGHAATQEQLQEPSFLIRRGHEEQLSGTSRLPLIKSSDWSMERIRSVLRAGVDGAESLLGDARSTVLRFKKCETGEGCHHTSDKAILPEDFVNRSTEAVRASKRPLIYAYWALVESGLGNALLVVKQQVEAAVRHGYLPVIPCQTDFVSALEEFLCVDPDRIGLSRPARNTVLRHENIQYSRIKAQMFYTESTQKALAERARERYQVQITGIGSPGMLDSWVLHPLCFALRPTPATQQQVMQHIHTQILTQIPQGLQSLPLVLVAVHVRRGDFTKAKGNKGVLSSMYYLESWMRLRARVAQTAPETLPNLVPVIFSEYLDDPFLLNLSFPGARFVVLPKPASVRVLPQIDLYAMSLG